MTSGFGCAGCQRGDYEGRDLWVLGGLDFLVGEAGCLFWFDCLVTEWVLPVMRY